MAGYAAQRPDRRTGWRALLLIGTVPLAIYSAVFVPGRLRPVERARSDDRAHPRVIAMVQLASPALRRSADVAAGTRLVRIPADATEVRLDVPLGDLTAPREELEVELFHVDGDPLPTEGRWRVASTAAGAVLAVTVPAEEFVDGYYTLTVRRRTASGPDLAAHAFRVSRE